MGQAGGKAELRGIPAEHPVNKYRRGDTVKRKRMIRDILSVTRKIFNFFFLLLLLLFCALKHKFIYKKIIMPL